jgi:orotate phosphoribosyltransferase-like protein
MVIPSLTSRPGVHPLAEIARAVNAVGKATLVPTPEALCDRVIRADKSMLAPGARVTEQHVVILDDIWTTGSTPSRQR